VTALDQKPTRCSWCFGKFMHNHRPKQVIEQDGTIRWMHNSCHSAWKTEHTPHKWPAQTVWPDKDE
jgi:hypothetical protein